MLMVVTCLMLSSAVVLDSRVGWFMDDHPAPSSVFTWLQQVISL